MRFRSKERGTRVTDHTKNDANKRAGRGWGRKVWNKPLIDTCQYCSTSQPKRAPRSLSSGVFKILGFVCKRFIPSPPSPPYFIFRLSFFFVVRLKPKILFLSLVLLWNQTETFATQAWTCVILGTGGGGRITSFLSQPSRIFCVSVWLANYYFFPEPSWCHVSSLTWQISSLAFQANLIHELFSFWPS